jgi:glycogen synthase
MPDDEIPEPRYIRGRIVMLVDNGVRGDSRVQKEAAAAADAGWEVILLGRTTESKEERWQIGGAQVRLIPMPEVLNRKRHDFRRPFLRRPLAYPPNGIAQYHVQRAAAWRADLTARFAELDVRRREDPNLARRLARRRFAMNAELLAAKARSRWVTFRRGQLVKTQKRREHMTGAWDRLLMRFWRATMGDRAWRRLEPRLWEFELAFGKVIDRLRPDLIHANDFYMLPVGARAVLRARAAERKVALIWDAHELVSGIKSRSKNIRWLPAHIAHEREYARYADATTTVSEELADELQSAHRLPERPTVVLNTPDVNRAEPGAAPDLREVCGVRPDVPLLVYSGAAAPQRGLDTMIDALPQMPEVHVALIIAMPPSKYIQGLVTKAESLGAGPRLHLAPYVPFDQVVEYLSGADAGVIPIHKWPNHEIALITKFFEYAHARLPMIVSDVRAMANATRDLGQGEVFRAEDAEDYVRAVKLVLADPARYRAVYDRPGLLDSWTWPAQAAVLDAVYARVAPKGIRRAAAGSIPDVSVIVPVRNAMPHLVRNIRRLLDQTLGLDRFEVIAIDDGSTDDGGARLDSYVRRYPEMFRVVHRRGVSSGPAAAYNIALDMARGRYVTFVGAGDLLGPEALERMVIAADEYGSDVLAMRMVGLNGRTVPTEAFTDNRAEVEPFGTELTAALSNTKLFRRRLIEEHRLRYPEELSVGSDQPFTLAALRHARRVSVLADYDYYFAVARRGMGAASRTSPDERLRAADQVMRLLADQVPEGPERDAVLRRHFSVELAELMGEGLLTLPRRQQESICAGIGRLADAFLTDGLAVRLSARHRVRARLAQHGRLDDLLGVISQDSGPRPAPIVAVGTELYLGYDCFGAISTGLSDETFRITHDLAELVAGRVEVTSLRWERDGTGRPALIALAHSPVDLGGPGATPVSVTVGDEPMDALLEPAAPGSTGTRLRITMPLDRLLEGTTHRGERRYVIVKLSLADGFGQAHLRVATQVPVARRFVRGDDGRLRLSAARSSDGTMIINYAPITVSRVAAKVVRTLVGGTGES